MSSMSRQYWSKKRCSSAGSNATAPSGISAWVAKAVMTAEAASKVLKGWAYVPYQGYANCVFGDSVGKALPGKTDMAA